MSRRVEPWLKAHTWTPTRSPLTHTQKLKYIVSSVTRMSTERLWSLRQEWWILSMKEWEFKAERPQREDIIWSMPWRINEFLWVERKEIILQAVKITWVKGPRNEKIWHAHCSVLLCSLQNSLGSRLQGS